MTMKKGMEILILVAFCMQIQSKSDEAAREDLKALHPAKSVFDDGVLLGEWRKLKKSGFYCPFFLWDNNGVTNMRLLTDIKDQTNVYHANMTPCLQVGNDGELPSDLFKGVWVPVSMCPIVSQLSSTHEGKAAKSTTAGHGPDDRPWQKQLPFDDDIKCPFHLWKGDDNVHFMRLRELMNDNEFNEFSPCLQVHNKGHLPSNLLKNDWVPISQCSKVLQEKKSITPEVLQEKKSITPEDRHHDDAIDILLLLSGVVLFCLFSFFLYFKCCRRKRN